MESRLDGRGLTRMRGIILSRVESGSWLYIGVGNRVRLIILFLLPFPQIILVLLTGGQGQGQGQGIGVWWTRPRK